MAVLCTCYEIYLRDRYTGAQIEGCDLSQVGIEEGFYSRDQSITSGAYIKFGLAELGCCECGPVPWEHELVIEAVDNATGNTTEAWSGIITETLEDRTFGTYEIFAFDRSILWTRQPYTTRDLFFPAGTDEATVWAALITEAEQCVVSGLAINPTETGCPIVTDRIIPAGTDLRPILQELDSVKWTVVSNRLLGPGPNTQGEQVRHTLATDIDWLNAGAVIHNDGNFTATHVTVTNTEPGDLTRQTYTGSFPTGPPRPTRGPGCHTLRIVDPKIMSDQQAQQRAREIYNERRNGNRSLATSAGTLAPETELCVADLIPGRRMSVETSGTCDDFTQIVELNRVLVGFAQSSQLGEACVAEQRVAIDLIPVGGEPSSRRVSV